MSEMNVKKINCGEIWGGIRGVDVKAITSAIEAHLFSAACDGGKGGDIYYFSVCGQDLLTRIALADVIGHGQAVSDTSEWLFQSLRERMDTIEGNEVLSDLNKLAVAKGYEAITTAAVAAFYRETNDLFFSYAGHHPVLVLRQGERDWASVDLPDTEYAANLPLGVDVNFPYEQATIALCSGDMLFLYTDGVIEAPNSKGELFGLARLKATLRSSQAGPQNVRDKVVDVLMEFVEGDFSHDDVTFMVIQIK